jgi:hypothetical protein
MRIAIAYNHSVAFPKMQKQHNSTLKPHITTSNSPSKMTSHNSMSRNAPSKPIIFSIPLEIRQHILSYAFCEAICQDIAFNAKLQKDIPNRDFGSGLFLSTLDDLNDIISEDDEFTGLRRRSCVNRSPCAPRIYAMANKISEVHPQLKEEVKFVFKQCLEQFRS